LCIESKEAWSRYRKGLDLLAHVDTNC